MCGIGLLDCTDYFDSLSYRGPDKTKCIKLGESTLCFHRLSINDLTDNGDQPFVNNNTYLVCNGEIYNHEQLKHNSLNIKSNSDCEVLFHLLNENNENSENICKSLDGDFAFIYVQNIDSKQVIIAGRDPIGVRPLFYGFTTNNKIQFCSEIKGLKTCNRISYFPPGFVWTSNNGFVSYSTLTLPKNPCNDYQCSKIQELLIESVKKRLLSDRPIGFFLSGGLDSSIIAAIGSKLLYPQRIKTFSIGIKGFDSPDLKAAKVVSDFLNTDHHVYEFSFEEAIQNINQTIWHLESYDCTTIRASVPMFLLSKYVSENFDCKVILSGEGADELFGGYIYFHDAPTDDEFQSESIRLIKNVHQFDVLRADRCTSGNGLELRVPFFDKTFVEYVTNISPIFKVCRNHWMEKNILRRSFEGWLPDSILWRQKNGMSDAVGYSWIDSLKEYINKQKLHIESFNHCKFDDFEKNKPLTNEELWYRIIYTNLFGNVDCLDGIWRPKWTSEIDPSARNLKQFKY